MRRIKPDPPHRHFPGREREGSYIDKKKKKKTWNVYTRHRVASRGFSRKRATERAASPHYALRVCQLFLFFRFENFLKRKFKKFSFRLGEFIFCGFITAKKIK
jgi:hypothetical protein